MSDRSQPASPPALVGASMLLVPAGAYGFVRLFSESSDVVPIIAAAIISGGLSVVLRTLRVGLAWTFALSLAALFVLLEIRYAPGTQRLGLLPTRTTFEAFRLLAVDGVEQFQDQKAPVDSIDSFIAASMISAWLMSFLTEWGALRLRLAFEPVLPATILFVFAAILGSGDYQQRSTVLFALAIVAWSVTQRVTNLASRGVWLVADARRGPRGIAQSALALSFVALLVGLSVGPLLPGAESEELYYWRERGDPTRYVTSPFVNIEKRLAEQTDVIMFSVTADEPAYWRIAGLDTYEDGFWQMKGSFQEQSGDLPQTTTSSTSTGVLRQEFQIEALSSVWLPAAFSPSRIVSSDVPATWNVETSSLTVNKNDETSDGTQYVVESTLAQHSPAELRSASAVVPVAIAERYLAMPDELSPVVQREALAITAGLSTRYDQMLALQAYFRDFEYSLRLGPRGEDPIAQFLDERVGFCQQFSGTFALMARSIGAPARVAVGFTWGDRVEGTDTYLVSGRHTHAWPEVWFEDLGWVAFEPTPGRGAPNSGHTTLEQSQDSDVVDDAETPGTTLPPEPLDLDQSDLNIPDVDLGLDETTTAGSGESARSVPWRLVLAIAAALGVGAGFPLLHAARRRLQMQHASSPAARIETAWRHAGESLELGYAINQRPAETHTEFADRSSKIRRVPGDAVRSLASATTVARYSSGQDLSANATDATRDLRTIQQTVREQVSWWRRWTNDLDPRRLSLLVRS